MGVSLELDCSPWLDGKYKYTLKITRSVIKNGKRINSQRLKLPTGKTLSNEARNKFEVDRIKIDVRLAGLRKNK